MVVLDDKTLRASLPLAEAVEACAEAFRAQAAGDVLEGPATVTHAGAGLRVLTGTALQRAAVATWIGLRPAGAGTAHDTAVLVDAAEGRGQVALHGYDVAVLGAAATAGAAVDLLARADAGLVALFGTGRLAAALLEAVCSVRPVTQVRVVGRDPARTTAFVARVRAQAWIRDATVLAAQDPHLATRGAELVLTATRAEGPVLPADEVAPGACLVAAGTAGAWAGEVPRAVVERSLVVTDNVEAVRQWAGAPPPGWRPASGGGATALADAYRGCPRPAGGTTLVGLVGNPVAALVLCRLAAARASG
jgi:ornithine cyclodeaminase